MNKDSLNQAIVWLLNEKYNGRLTTEAEKDITRLAKGEPVDYLIGYKKFCGCKIDLRYNPLIPRDETEFWVGKAIKNLRGMFPRKLTGEHPPLLRSLDIFAGSGCIGIAVLKHIPSSHCDFADIDDNCLKQIWLNLKLNGIDKTRYRVVKSDIFSTILSANCLLPTTNYDIILANSPYIGLNQKQKVQKSVLNFEPKNALFAKENGLFFIKNFLQKAKDYLTENGVIFLEFAYNQKNDIKKILEKQGYQNFEFYKDQFGKWRFVKIG